MNDKNYDVKNSYMNEDNTTLVKFTTINNDNGYNDYNDYSVDTIITTKTIIRLIKTIIIIVIMKNKRWIQIVNNNTIHDTYVVLPMIILLLLMIKLCY